MVPIDFRKNSETALDHACGLGRQFDAKIHLVHVVDTNSHDASLLKAEEQLLTTLLPSQENTLDIQRRVLRGSIAEQLGEYSHSEGNELLDSVTSHQSEIYSATNYAALAFQA